MPDETPPAEAKKEEGKKAKLVKGRHRSAMKRHRESVKRGSRNRIAISTLRSALKKVRQAVAAKDGQGAQTTLKTAVSLLHRAARRGFLHHRNASRHIARLSRSVARMA